MKTKWICLILISTFSFASSALSFDPLRVETRLPDAVQNYYNDYNFVSVFSTEKDREHLAQYVLMSLEEQRNSPLPKHLRGVREAVSRLEARTYEVDSGIKVLEICPEKAEKTKVVRLSENELLITVECDPEARFLLQHRAQIIEPKQISVFREGVAVKVRVHALDKDRQQTLLTRYKAFPWDKQRLPSPQEQLNLCRGDMIGEEIQYWRRIHNQWMKEAVEAVFIGGSAL